MLTLGNLQELGWFEARCVTHDPLKLTAFSLSRFHDKTASHVPFEWSVKQVKKKHAVELPED